MSGPGTSFSPFFHRFIPSRPHPFGPPSVESSAAMGAIPAIRRLLLALLSLGLAGTSVELLLLGHYEDVSQFVPLVLIGAAAVVLAWHAVRPRPATARGPP